MEKVIFKRQKNILGKVALQTKSTITTKASYGKGLDLSEE